MTRSTRGCAASGRPARASPCSELQDAAGGRAARRGAPAGERRLLRRLVARRCCRSRARRDLPAGDRDRVVPRHEQRHDAARLVDHQVGGLPAALQARPRWRGRARRTARSRRCRPRRRRASPRAACRPRGSASSASSSASARRRRAAALRGAARSAGGVRAQAGWRRGRRARRRRRPRASRPGCGRSPRRSRGRAGRSRLRQVVARVCGATVWPDERHRALSPTRSARRVRNVTESSSRVVSWR